MYKPDTRAGFMLHPGARGRLMETLVHTDRYAVAGREYEVQVFRRPDGSHVARTAFTPRDVIINDGPSLDEVLARHRRLLALAVNSREILRIARPTI